MEGISLPRPETEFFEQANEVRRVSGFGADRVESARADLLVVVFGLCSVRNEHGLLQAADGAQRSRHRKARTGRA